MKNTFICLLLSLACQLWNAEITGHVIRVTDGDTVTIVEKNNSVRQGRFRIRLYGIDAPEKKQPFGEKAKETLEKIIYLQTVRVEFYEIDRYGRIIGTIYLAEQNINLKMLASGMAWHYKQYSQDKEYSEAEAKARAEKTGLWLDDAPIPP